jgi:hypothetical protein
MTGTNQIYARHFRGPRAGGYTPKAVDKDPSLGVRLDKVLKEHLNDRTKQFVNSLKSWFDKKGGLTSNQLRSFEAIESRFSPGEKEKLEKWETEYRTLHVEDATILARYYLTAGYWTQMAQSILSVEGYVPPKHKYVNMSKNKYALNVLKNVKDAPKFEKGVMVQLRGTVGKSVLTRHLAAFRSRLCFVIDCNSQCVSATKGGKGYKVLPMGHSVPLNVEERDLMKPNKKGKSL